MRKLAVTEFVSLDGVFEDPGGAEKSKHGAWTFQFDRGPQGDKFKLGELFSSDIQLLGRVTYQGFATAWPSIKDEAGFGDKMNGMPKYVVSSTLRETDLTWENSHLLKGGDKLSDEVNKLKQQGDGDILVAGSGQLVRCLMEHDLVDEYRLMIFPVVLGSGRRLFEGAPKQNLKLIATQKLGSGIMLMTYVPGKDQTGK